MRLRHGWSPNFTHGQSCYVSTTIPQLPGPERERSRGRHSTASARTGDDATDTAPGSATPRAPQPLPRAAVSPASMCSHLDGVNLQALTNSLHIVHALLAQTRTRILLPRHGFLRAEHHPGGCWTGFYAPLSWAQAFHGRSGSRSAGDRAGRRRTGRGRAAPDRPIRNRSSFWPTAPSSDHPRVRLSADWTRMFQPAPFIRSRALLRAPGAGTTPAAFPNPKSGILP